MDGRLNKIAFFLIFSLAFFSVVSFSAPFTLGPWLLPGNLAVKSDIDLLADAGLIKAPVLTWPLAWGSIAPDLLSVETKAKLSHEPQSVQDAYYRILALYEQTDQLHKVQGATYASVSNHLNPFPTFEYQPYENFATGAAAAYQVKHFAGALNVNYYHLPNETYPDNSDAHFNNSYADIFVGNWSFGIDQFDRWWGPGYSDSVILSTNAEPMPTFTIQRIRALAPTFKWLRWIGPWSLTSSLSQLEENRPEPETIAWFTDFSFRPTAGLQFDLGRGSLFAGSERTLTPDMLRDLLTFQGNCPPWHNRAYCYRNTPGKEHLDLTMRGDLYDRWKIPFNFFLQTVFNDHIPGISPNHYDPYGFFGQLPLPARTAFLAGMSTWGQTRAGFLRLYAEYEYTYENDFWFWGGREYGIYEYGGALNGYPYTYYNRILGSSLGNEAIGYTVGSVLNESSTSSDTFSLRYLELNGGNISGRTYLFKRQNVVWASVGKTFVLPHALGNISQQVGYLFSVSGQGLCSGSSLILTWFKNF